MKMVFTWKLFLKLRLRKKTCLRCSHIKNNILVKKQENVWSQAFECSYPRTGQDSDKVGS